MLRAALIVVILATAVTIIAGCESAGAASTEGDGGGTDGGEVADGPGAGDGDGDGDGEASVPATLDTSTMVLHLGLDGDLADETDTSSSMTIIADGESTVAPTYGQDREEGGNRAIQFDGSYSLRISDVTIDTASSITVMAWVRDDGSQTTKDRWIVSHVSSTNAIEFAARIRTLGSETWQDGSFEAFVEDSGSNGTRTTTFVMPGSWVHVAMVYDDASGELRLYQDGVRKNVRSVALDIAPGNVIVGGGNNENNDFHGLIDDVAIFTRALTDAEIALAKDQIGTE
jgi:hypothetical protein